MIKKWKVLPKESGMRLVNFLVEKYHQKFSARYMKKAIEANLCRVNGQVERFASFAIRAGDEIAFTEKGMVKLEAKTLEVEPKRVLFEDDHLFVYNKPAGINSDSTGIAALFKQYKLVHRLDNETTGVLVFAKSSEVQRKMITLFKDFAVQKEYFAIVDGVPKKRSDLIESFIGRLSSKGKELMWGTTSGTKGKWASTSWRVTKKGKNVAMVSCAPKTGRTHQIRVHMKEIGHPILGDYRYAKTYRCTYPAKRCLLHAFKIVFPHPVTGGICQIMAPIPQDFKNAIRTLFK